MAFLGKAAFAKLAGVSRQRIYQMVDAGHLTVRPDGKLDTEDRTNKNYINSHGRPNQEHKNPSDETEVFTGKVIDMPKPIKQSSKKKTETDGKSDISLDKYALQCKKIEVDTEKNRVVMLEKRMELLPRNFVKQVLSRLYSIDTQELLQVPAKVSPDITAELGLDDPSAQIIVEKIIEKEIYNVLDRSKKELIKELKDYKLKLEENMNALDAIQLA